MKKAIIVISVLAMLALVSCASTSNVDFSALTEGVQKVIEVPNESKDALFVKANNWAVSAFNSADSVIEFSDKESGTITGKYTMKFQGNAWNLKLGGWKVSPLTLMEINIKEGKARITLKLVGVDLYNGYGVKSSGDLKTNFVQEDADILMMKWDNLITDFEKALTKTVSDDW